MEMAEGGSAEEKQSAALLLANLTEGCEERKDLIHKAGATPSAVERPKGGSSGEKQDAAALAGPALEFASEGLRAGRGVVPAAVA